MARVDFYILSAPSTGERLQFACRLTEKIYKMGLTCFIFTASQEMTETLDQTLWSFREQSFIPHTRYGAGDAQTEPVLVGSPLSALPPRDVLINLSADLPPDFSQFQRIAEIIAADSTAKQIGRARFRWYRDAGHDVQTHEI